MRFKFFVSRQSKRPFAAQTTRRRPPPQSVWFRPNLEGLEDRMVLSTLAPPAPALGAALAAPIAHGHHILSPINMLPMSINSVGLQNGQLVANGTLGSTAFQLPLTLTSSPNAADPTCPILNLSIPQGIHLSLLGLNVDTSGICLKITGESGPGNLLGNLVCGLANALNPGGGGLLSFLNGLSVSDLNSLLGSLSGLLNSAVGDLTTVNLGTGLGASPSVMGPTCNILHLALGPLDLNLLGLDVKLDNCHGGPVTVDVTATPGAGHLLGNLLCNLSNLLNSNASLTALENSLGRVANDILSRI